MATAGELRAEAARIRAFALSVTDAEAVTALQELADELEARAAEFDGDGDGDGK